MKKLSCFKSILLLFAGFISWMSSTAQTYTVSPSGYTNVPTSNVTHGSKTLHGNLLQAKATVSGTTATFTLKKSDGSKFKNRGSIFVRLDSYSNNNVQPSVQYEAGIYNPTVDVELDFSSGSKTYVIVLSSKGDETIYYYTNPITITAESSPSPTKPAYPSPEDGATNVPTEGTFSWKTSARDGGDVLNYDLYLDTNPEFTSANKLYGQGSGKSCGYKDLKEGTKYYWKVVVYNGSGKSTHSDKWSFTTVESTPSPTKPAYPSPEDGATNVPTEGTFSWKTSARDGGDVLNYDLYLDTNPEFTSANKLYGQGSGKSCGYKDLEEGTKYYWKVVVYNGSGKSTHSDKWSFTTSSRYKLSTPNKNTFKASQLTETSFIASWDAVPGALYYDINVKKESGGDYSNPDFNGGTSNTSIKVTGLNPNTSYLFQVRARNDKWEERSDWSASIPTAVTTKRAGTEPANLSIYSVRGFDGTKSMTVGLSYSYKVYVINNGTSDWKGAFYLKEGNENVYVWEKISLPGNNKMVQPLEFEYTPEKAGSHTLTLYYQTNTTGGGLPVNAGNGKNPMTIQVNADPSVYDGLKLKSAIVYPQTIALGQKAKISAQVQNTGSKNWKGTIYLVDNGVIIGYTQDLSSGKDKTIYATNWEPQTAGNHTISVEYKSENSTGQYLVDANGQTNPVSILVSNTDALSDASEIILTHLTKDVMPTEVTPGSNVYYYYRLLDSNGRPLRGMKLRFKRTNTTMERIEESQPSDDEGYAILCLQTDGGASIGRRGETITHICTTAINEAGKSIPVRGKSSDDTKIKITIHQGNTFSEGSGTENVGKASLTMALGVSEKSDWKFEKNKLGSNGNLGGKTTLGFTFDEEGSIDMYSIDGEFYGAFSVGLERRNLLKEFSIDDASATYWSSLLTPSAVQLGAKGNLRWGSSTSNLKDLLVRYVMSYVDNYTEGTSASQDFMVKALRYWYSNERKDEYFWNCSYGGSAKVKGDLLSKWPRNSWARPLMMPVIKYADLSLTGEGSFTLEPEKEKQSWNTVYDGDYVSDYSSNYLKGSGSTLKLSGTFDAKLKLKDLIQRAESSWLGTKAMKSFNLKQLDKTNPSASYSYDRTFTLKHEEMYNDNEQLREVSQSVAFSAGREISADGVELFGWKPGEYAFGISNKTTSKITSKGDWASFLKRVSLTDGSESYLKQLLQGVGLGGNDPDNYRQQVFKVFPNLARNTIICSPAEIYNAWTNELDDYAKPLGILASITPNPQDYKLKEALKLEQTVTSELDMNVKIHVFDFKSDDDETITAKFNFDTGLTLGIDNKPSTVSYFSLPDRRFFTILQRPVTTIEQTKDWLLDFITRKIGEAFMENEDGILNAVQWLKDLWDLTVDKSSKIWDNSAGDFIEDYIMYPIAERYYMSDMNNAIARHAILRHPKLAEKRQEDISQFCIGINKGTQNFNPGVNLKLSHHYPAGDLLGMTEQGDTLFVVSDVIHIAAYQDDNMLTHTQQGNFSIEGIPGADDLVPFGFREDQPLDVYYSGEDSDIWHYLGPAGTTIMTDKLGAYMMGTSIKNDVLSPEILADYDEQTGVLHIKVNENIGLRVNTLSVTINGVAKDVTAINESNFEVYLSEEEMKYMLTLYVTVYDLAGNQGHLFQIFNLDKPDSIEDIKMEQGKENAEIYLSRNMLKVTGSEADATIMLFSVKGDVITKGRTDDSGQAEIRLSHLPAGIYIVTLSNGMVKKFIIQ